MPVDDHPIHPSTQKGKDFRYGCWNRKPFADGYTAPNGYAEIMDDVRGWWDARIKLTFIPHAMSKECKYDLSHKDAACEGCKHKMIDLQREQND